jgi:hypothetical protein
VVNRWLPHLYYSCRVGLLPWCFVFTGAWAYFGFDSTVDGTFTGGIQGVGFHWSTLSTMATAGYLMLVYLQVGSFKTLIQEMKLDLYALRRFRRGDFYNERVFAIDGARGTALVFFVVWAAMFIFETPWVLLHDYFSYGSWLWPIYFVPNIFFRNVGLAAICVFGILAVVYSFNQVNKGRMKVTFRFDEAWVLLLTITLAVWLLWVSGSFPHQTVAFGSLSPAQVVSPLKHLPANFSTVKYSFPTQTFFPQTEYTFYPAYMVGHQYNLSRIYGFYVADPITHLINITAKYLVFAVVCYPALLVVKSQR